MRCSVCTREPPSDPPASRSMVEDWVQHCNTLGIHCEKHLVSACLQEIINTEEFAATAAVIKHKIEILQSFLIISEYEPGPGSLLLEKLPLKIEIKPKDEPKEFEDFDDDKLLEDEYLVDVDLDEEDLNDIIMKDYLDDEEETDFSNSDEEEKIRYVKKVKKEKKPKRIKSSQDGLQCNLCDFRTRGTKVDNRKLLNKHKLSVHGIEYRTRTESHVDKLKHAELIYRCALCKDREFVKRDTLRSHINHVHKRGIVESDIEYVCNSCRSACPSLRDYSQHMFHVHEQKLCDCCGVLHQEFEEYWQHTRPRTGWSNKGGPKYKANCDICNREFNSERSMILHRSKAHMDMFPERLKVCPHCGKSTLDLKQHLTVSCPKNNTKVQCQICGSEISKYYLKDHIRTVHQPQSEKIECANCGTMVKDIQTHINNVRCDLPEEERQKLMEKCELCNKYVKSLVKHINYHHKAVELKCDFCDFKTKYIQNLNLHVKRIHEQKPLKEPCPYCGKEVQSLKFHIKRSHAGIV